MDFVAPKSDFVRPLTAGVCRKQGNASDAAGSDLQLGGAFVV